MDPLRIINVSKTPAGTFDWYDGKLPAELSAQFTHYHASPNNALERKITSPNIALHRGSLQAAQKAQSGSADILVSHLPVVSKWVEFYRLGRKRKIPHLAFAFNHDVMPTGKNKDMMIKLYRDVERFVVFSSAEKQLYADELKIPKERIDMVHWGVVPPEVDTSAPPLIEGDYITAIGRSGRNYKVMIEALKALPDIKAVIVASPENMKGLDVPPNVEVREEIPWNDMLNILYHSRFMVLPLFKSDIPYGHGTAILAMHLNRPVIVTDGDAMSDYVQDGETGLMYPADDSDALADRIKTLWDNSEENERLAQNAYQFAHSYCTEAASIARVAPLLQEVIAQGTSC